MKGRFHVKDTFEVPSGQIFVMAGSVVEGEISAGMFVHIPLNSLAAMTLRIHCIEAARRQDGDDVCLCFESQGKAGEFLRGLNIRNETFDVTTEGSD
jgi:hypothetical protein